MSECINNQSRREEQLKRIIRRLHEGAATSDLVAEFGELLEDVGPDEIVRMEESLVNEGLDPEEIQPLCDLHVQVFRTSLDKQQAPDEDELPEACWPTSGCPQLGHACEKSEKSLPRTLAGVPRLYHLLRCRSRPLIRMPSRGTLKEAGHVFPGRVHPS